MHKVIMGTKKGKIVDHKNRNSLNNQRYNLRFCTPSQSCMNRQKTKNLCASKYKGVSFRKNRSTWTAEIYVDNIRIYLGSYKIEEQAALMYNFAAIKYHKEFACLNELPEEFKQQFKEIDKIVKEKGYYD